MSDEINEDEFFLDVCVRLIENEILRNNGPKLGVILAGVLDSCVITEEDTPDVIEWKRDLVTQLTHELMYHEVVQVPSEEEIDGEVKKFSDWLEDATAKEKPKTEEEN